MQERGDRLATLVVVVVVVDIVFSFFACTR